MTADDNNKLNSLLGLKQCGVYFKCLQTMTIFSGQNL